MPSSSSPADLDSVLQLLRTHASAEPTNITALLQVIADNVCATMHADIVAVYPINPVTVPYPGLRRFMQPPVISGQMRSSSDRYAAPPRSHGLTERIIADGELFVEDIEEQPDLASIFTQAESIRAFGAVALRHTAQGKTFGVAYMNYHRPRRFTGEERERLLRYCQLAAHVLQPAWYLRRYLEVIQIGQEINQSISDADSLFGQLSQHLPEIIDTSHAFVFALNKPECGTLDVYAWNKGIATKKQDVPFEGVYRAVIQSGKPLLIRALSRERETLQAQGTEVVDFSTHRDAGQGPLEEESLVFVPIGLRDQLSLGVLSVQHHKPDVYDLEDQRLLEALSPYLALALTNIKLFSDLVSINQTGQALTGMLDEEHVLEDVVAKIHQATGSDLVILYEYDETKDEFTLPPKETGESRSPDFPQKRAVHAGDMVYLAVHTAESVFASNSADLFGFLGGEPTSRVGAFEEREHIASTAALPLRVGNEPVGALFINFRHHQDFPSAQKNFIQSLGAFAAIAIKNSRRYRELKERRLHELELLQEIDKRIGTILELPKLLQEILELADEQVRADEACILLYEPKRNVLRPAAATGRNKDLSMRQVVDVAGDKGIVRLAFLRQEPIRIYDVKTDEEYAAQHLVVTDDTHAELDVPILDGQTVIGVLNFESVERGAFSATDQHLITTLAGQAALAIRNATAYDRERRIAVERQVLIDIGREIVAQLDLQQVFRLLLQKALEVTKCESGNLMLYDPDKDDLWMAAQQGERNYELPRLPIGEGIVGWVAQYRVLKNLGNVSLPPWNKTFLGFLTGTRSELAVPLLEGGRLRGVLNIESKEENFFTESDERLLTALASLAVIALLNAERYGAALRGKERQHTLNQVVQQIVEHADSPEAVMEAIVESAMHLTDAQQCKLTLYGDDGREANFFRRKGDEDAAGPSAPAQSVLSVALKTEQNQAIGLLTLESNEAFAFDAEDRDIIELLAGHAAIAYQLAKSYASTDAERKRFRILNEAGRRVAQVASRQDIESIYQVVGEVLSNHLPEAEIVIRKFEETTKELVVTYVAQRRGEMQDQRIPMDQGINGLARLSKELVIVHDVENPPEGVRPSFRDPQVRTAIAAPIWFKDRYYGNIVLTATRTYAFHDADIALIDGLARQIAVNLYRLEMTDERILAEQRYHAAEAMNSMGQSAFELAHRLGNDLGVIDIYLGTIRDELRRHNVQLPEVEAELRKIDRDVREVLSFTTKLKSTFRDIRLGEQELVREHVPLRALVEDAAQSYPLIPANIVVNVLDMPNGVNLNIDHSLVADILRNLVTNAVQAMPNGGTLELSARLEGRFARIRVRDTGYGIAGDRLPRIFDLFYTTKDDGNGFGLWSSRRNALAHGGDLTVDSIVGKGTMFTLSLPYVGTDRVSSY